MSKGDSAAMFIPRVDFELKIVVEIEPKIVSWLAVESRVVFAGGIWIKVMSCVDFVAEITSGGESK